MAKIPSLITIVFGVLIQGLANAIWQEEKKSEIGKEETKLSLFAHDMIM